MPKQPALNRFNAGINTDMNSSDVQAQFMRDAMNCRISKLEDGMYAATVKGNTLTFSLNANYIPLGASSYNGVLYIISLDVNTGLSEIGTYPKPNYTTTGYTNVYAPLAAFTLENPSINTNDCIPYAGLTLSDFRYKLNMDCQHAAKVLIREDYDGSVNIYWTDNKNPVRVVNSGFVSASGLANQRFTTSRQIDSNAISLINESSFHPIIKLTNVITGGNMKAGHYFFYVRYTDNNYNATSFLGQSKPIAVFNEKTVNGSPFVAYGGEANTATNQMVVLNITNLDEVSTFLEVGFVYYYSETEYEAKIIDLRYAINGQSNLQVIVTGNESLITTTIDVLTAFKPADAIRAKDITQLNNIFYMANTAGPELDHRDLRIFCCAVELSEDSSYRRLISNYIPSSNPDNTQLYSTNEQDVHTKVGYWSEETYIFGLVPVFKGGYIGRAFPVRGFDNRTNVKLSPNKSGIFRFSAADVLRYYDGSHATVKGIRFDITPAIGIFNNSQWLKDNVIGFYLVRGERNKNILYQGMAIRPTNVPNINAFSFYKDRNGEPNKYLPLIGGLAYAANAILAGLLGPGTGPFYAGLSTGTVSQELNDRLAVFSLDYHLDKRKVPVQSFVKRLGGANLQPRFNNTTSRPFTVVSPFNSGSGNLVMYEQTDLVIDAYGFTAETVNVLGWTVAKNRSFSSKVTEGVATGAEGFFYLHTDRSAPFLNDTTLNLPMAMPDYIGVIGSPAGTGWDNTIVNVCKTDPTLLDYTKQYDFKNTLFSAISDFISIDVFLQGNVTAYQGDCFIARDYLKVCHGFTDELGEEFTELLGKTYNNDYYGQPYSSSFAPSDVFLNGWGHGLSLVVEHNYNPNYRYELGRNFFYPATGIADNGKDFFWLLDAPESNFYNGGYKRMLSARQQLGIDIFEPISNNRFPTRIRPSTTHVFGALKDGYRVFRGGEQDFSYQYGAINAIAAFREQLYSVQDNAINVHPVNERTQVPSEGGSIAIAQQIGLSGYKQTLIDVMGTQHRDSVIVAEGGLYGFDFNRKAFWRIGGGGVEHLGLTKACQQWILNLTDTFTKRADILSNLPEQHICGNGILSAYDAQNKEVVMTFHMGEQHHTICFSELIDNFQTKYYFTPRFYANIKDDFFSFDSNHFWLHDSNDANTNFYGKQAEFFIKFVCNDAPELLKHFDNLTINSNNCLLSYIEYETQHQLAKQDPFVPITQYWYKPEYRRNAWHLPVRRADAVKEPVLSLYGTQSPIVGMHLAIKLGYRESKPLGIRDVLTYHHIHPKT